MGIKIDDLFPKGDDSSVKNEQLLYTYIVLLFSL